MSKRTKLTIATFAVALFAATGFAAPVDAAPAVTTAKGILCC